MEAKEDIKRAVRVETERQAIQHEVAMARLEIDAMSGARAQVEAELARVWDVLVASDVKVPNKPWSLRRRLLKGG